MTENDGNSKSLLRRPAVLISAGLMTTLATGGLVVGLTGGPSSAPNRGGENSHAIGISTICTGFR